ncbi:cytochrome c [Carboxylicivirga sp. M1479]|uniref:c-type cytochrome n=1 Tax=Carboxylicivirga sp. M1479 TaxID=2594476 RepID=UPI00117791E5|nr:cytochrome c [Carboxylicivirga sp. M1479]TRX65979.1 cytochrome c [Carboxylicivirga sp. M1479]
MRIGIVFIVMAMVLMSCGSSGSKKTKVNNPVVVADAEHPGKIIYTRHCMSCHQKDAGGIPKMYPPLAKNKVISGEKEALINIVLHGMSGEIEVDGIVYNGVMAGYKNISDKDIASVLNYLRVGFGNSGEEITPSEVKALR